MHKSFQCVHRQAQVQLHVCCGELQDEVRAIDVDAALLTAGLVPMGCFVSMAMHGIWHLFIFVLQILPFLLVRLLLARLNLRVKNCWVRSAGDDAHLLFIMIAFINLHVPLTCGGTMARLQGAAVIVA